MFRKSLAAAFAAAALAGLMTTAAPAQADIQAPATTQAVVPNTAIPRSAAMLQPGGPALPLVLAGKLLAREGWAPIAAGDDSPTSKLVVLRKQNTDLVRLVQVANGTLKVTAEGTATAFKKPAGPFGTASFDTTTMLPAVTLVEGRDAPGAACFNDAAAAKNKLIAEDGEGSIMKIKTATSTLEITTGLNDRNSWSLIETKDGQSQTCMTKFGYRFQVSTQYPQANWTPSPEVAGPSADQNTAPATTTSKSGVLAAPAISKSSLAPNL